MYATITENRNKKDQTEITSIMATDLLGGCFKIPQNHEEKNECAN